MFAEIVFDFFPAEMCNIRSEIKFLFVPQRNARGKISLFGALKFSS